MHHLCTKLQKKVHDVKSWVEVMNKQLSIISSEGHIDMNQTEAMGQDTLVVGIRCRKQS